MRSMLVITIIVLTVVWSSIGRAGVAQPAPTELASTCLVMERLAFAAVAANDVDSASAYIHAYLHTRAQIRDAKVIASLATADQYIAEVVRVNAKEIESVARNNCGHPGSAG